MARVRLLPATLLVAVAAATAGACGSTGGSGSASAGVTTPSAPGTTVTATVTTQNPPPTPTPTATTTTTAPTTTAAPPAPAPADAATVVNDYFAAINAQDYGRAWALGGKNLGSSYSSFVNGFAGTSADVVTVLDSTPTSVTVHLDAVQTDGSVKSFEGTYTVSDGRISRASVHAVAGSGSETSPPATTYKDCTDAHDHGASNIPSGDPRYQSKLDRDHDGRACEPYETGAP